jgi:hypothetical protein
VKWIRIRRSRKIKKFRRIKTPPLCGEYPSWVPYISFEGREGRDYVNYYIRNGIQY